MTTWTALLLCALAAWNAPQDAPRTPIVPTPESPAAQERVADPNASRSIAVYDCADLATPNGFDRRFRSPGDPEERERLERERLALIERSIRAYVRPKFLSGIDRLELHGGTTFVVTGTQAQHAWIRRFLELQRDVDAPYLSITAHHAVGSTACIEALGFEGPSQVVADPALARSAVARISEPSSGLRIVSAPRLLVASATPGEISIANQVSYVKSYDVVYVHPGPTAVADPVIDVIREGVRQSVGGVQVEPGLWALEVEIERTDVERPIPTEEVELTVDGPPVTIGKPSVRTSKLSTTVLLRDGGAVWFRAPEGEEELLVLVRMELVPEPTPAERSAPEPSSVDTPPEVDPAEPAVRIGDSPERAGDDED